MNTRRFIASVALAVALLMLSATATASASTMATGQASAPLSPTRSQDLNGICGTLLGAGVSAASLGQHVAARGAGWLGAILAGGCLLADLIEYRIAFDATPEGLARIAEMKARYQNRTYEELMLELGCKYIERPYGGPADTPDYGATIGHWDCRSYGD